MQRKSLDERLKGAPKPAIAVRLAQLNVMEHFNALEALGCSKKSALEWFAYLEQSLRDLSGVRLRQAMCDTVMTVANCDCDQGYRMLYALIINPIYQIQKQKEAARYDDTLCTQGNGLGSVQDDHVG